MNSREQTQRISGNRWVRSMGEALAWCQNGREGLWGAAGQGSPIAKTFNPATALHRIGGATVNRESSSRAKADI